MAQEEEQVQHQLGHLRVAHGESHQHRDGAGPMESFLAALQCTLVSAVGFGWRKEMASVCVTAAVHQRVWMDGGAGLYKKQARAEQSSEEAGEQTLTASKQLIKKVMGGAGR